VAYNLYLSEQIYQQIRDALGDLGKVSEERKRDELFKIFAGSKVSLALEILQNSGVLAVVLPEVQRLVDFQQESPHQFDGWKHTLETLHYCETMLNYIESQEKWDPPSVKLEDIYSILDSCAENFKYLLLSGLNVERPMRALFLFAACYHDVGKPLDVLVRKDNRNRYVHHAYLGAEQVQKRAKKMGLSKSEVSWLECFVLNHMGLQEMDVSSDKSDQRIFLYHFFQAAQQTAPFIALFSLADLLATYGDTITQERWQIGLYRCEEIIHGWFHEHASLVQIEPFLDGDELQKEFHLQPGKELGALLTQLRMQQAAGKICSKQQARDWVGTWLQLKKE